MRKSLTCLCTALVVVLFLAPEAGAQIESLGPPYEGVEGTQAVSSDEYIYDSGVSTTDVGLTNEGNAVAWIRTSSSFVDTQKGVDNGPLEGSQRWATSDASSVRSSRSKPSAW